MNKGKTYTANILGLLVRFLGTILIVAFIVPAVAFSQVPGVPVLSSPSNVASNVSTTPTMSWDAVPGSDTYRLQIATASDLTTGMVYDDATLTGPTNIIPGLVKFTQYYWRVSATKTGGGGGTSAYSTIWSFTTQNSAPTTYPLPIALGAAARFAVLSTTGVTNTGATNITGDVGASPIGGAAITGFGTVALTGTIYTTDATGPTDHPYTVSVSLLSQAIGDLTTAYGDAAGRSLNAIGVEGNIGGRTLYPGLYKSTGALEITSGDLTLDAQGDANAVWIFQIASGFNMADSRHVILANNASESNIFWQVGTLASFGSACIMKGTILAGTSCTWVTGSTLDGRALANNGNVTLQANTIVRPTIPTVFTNPTTVDLGTAATFRALSATTVTIASGCTVTGNVGGPSVTNNGIVNGDIWVHTWAGTEPSGTRHDVGTTVSTALSDLGTAITTASGITPNTPTLNPQLGNLTLGRGVYISTNGTFDITGSLTLTGTGTDIFIFQMTNTLTTAVSSAVILTGGAVWSNVFWQVGSSATLGASSVLEGTILAETYITQGASASLDGRALAHVGYVTLNGATALPVELTSFTGALNNSAVELNWNTATEINNYGYEVQKSRVQNSGWIKIGFVNGSGNSSKSKDYSFTESNLQLGKYYYRLKQIDNDGGFAYSNTIEVDVTSEITEFALQQNYPNPWNPTTTINYSLAKEGNVKLSVYNTLGSKVAIIVNEYKPAGNYSIQFNGSNLASGIYLYRLESGNYSTAKKFILMK